MNYGELRVLTPDGQTSVYPLETPAAVIGRSGENSVVIDHVSVARRHARLVIDSGNPYIEDLGSESGTFVAGRRLASGERAIMSEGTSVLIGDVSLSFRGAAADPPRGRALPANTFAAEPTPAPQPLVVAIEGPAAPVAPGTAGTTTVRIHNRGAVVDEVEITVQDMPADWIEVSRPVVTLLPGARQEVTIILRPPRGTGATAGEHQFAVSVRSREHGSEIRVIGSMEVPASSGFSIQLQPVRSKKRFGVRAVNTGNAPVAVALSGHDDEGKLNFAFGALNLDLQPGQQRDVSLDVKLRGAPKFGREMIHPFKVEAMEAQPAGSGASAPKQSADGQLRHKPPLQAWKFPVLGLIAVAALVGVVIGYTKNCEDQGWPGCGKDDGKLTAAQIAATAAAGGGAASQTAAGGPSAVVTPPPGGASVTPPPGGPSALATTPAVPTTPAPGGSSVTVPAGSTTVAPPSVSAVATTPAPAVTSVTPIKRPTFTKADSVLKLGADYTATISTTKGDFTIDLVTDKAPNTVNSFVFLAERGFFDGMPFTVARAVTAQNGDPTGDGSGGPGYATAYESTGLLNKRGTISMIPNTGSFVRVRQFGSQFFINLKDNVVFDSGGIAADIRPPFATVTKGMEIVDALASGDLITKIQIFEKPPGTVTPIARPTIGHPIIINTPAAN